MAPELIRNEKHDEKVDVWSYGIVVWEIVTRLIPFDGMEPFAIAFKIATGMRPPLSLEGMPPVLRVIMDKCLQEKPEKRLSFHEILRVLESVTDADFGDVNAEKFITSRASWKDEVRHHKLSDGDSVSLFDQQAILDEKEVKLSQREQEFVEREEALKKKALQIQKNSLMYAHPPFLSTLCCRITDSPPLRMAEKHQKYLERTFNYAGAIKVGDRMPSFSMSTAYGELCTLEGLLEKGPLILNYIRGRWCGFCEIELHKFAAHLNEFSDLKATLVVVSAQKRAVNYKTVTELSLTFDIVQDKHLECRLSFLFFSFFFHSKILKIDAKKLGIVFELPRDLVFIYQNEYGVDFGTYADIAELVDNDSASESESERTSTGLITPLPSVPGGSGSSSSSSAALSSKPLPGSPRRPSMARKYSMVDLMEQEVELPLPVTLVISPQGIVKYAFVNTDFKQRAPISEILEALESIAKEETQPKTPKLFDITPPTTPPRTPEPGTGNNHPENGADIKVRDFETSPPLVEKTKEAHDFGYLF